jgi:hypothetical protein
MRALFLAAALSFASTAAMADASVAGDWKADLGGNVIINMTVGPDGTWSSETVQASKTVRQMQGTYKQTPSGEGTGTLVFTPTKAKVKTGVVKPEVDKYELAGDGHEIKLTANGDTMVFEKQDHK